MIAKIQPCLWFDHNAEEAARFYAETFPDSRVGAISRAPADYPAGKKGDVLTVEMTILGMPFLLLNGGPQFTFDEAVSFQVATADQFIATVERITGRTVRAFASATDPDKEVVMENFIFEPDPRRDGRPAAPRRRPEP